MPAKEIKKPNGRYEVRTPNGIHAKNATKENADAQVRLLNAIEHSDWRPTKGYGLGKRRSK